jgi:hypothetical protein
VTTFVTITFLFLTISVGWLLLNQIWSDRVAWPTSELTNAALLQAKIMIAVGLGIGVSSCVWFACMMLNPSSALAPFFTEFILFALLGILSLLQSSRRKNAAQTAGTEDSAPIQDLRWLPNITIVALAISIGCFVLLSRAHIYGDWDALMIWNLHAKFLFAGKEHWQDELSNILFWSHPDYPLLIPGFIACCWRLLETTAPAIPQGLAFLFFIATALLVFSILLVIRGKSQAFLALALLVTTPNFVGQAANQCADIPLGYFILASLGCIFLASKFPDAKLNLYVTAGLMAGLAAWTKNEGLSFACILLFVQFVLIFRSNDVRTTGTELIAMLSGLLPVIIIILCFKHLAAPNDILGTQSLVQMITALSDWHRYIIVGQHFIYEVVSFGHWILSPVPILMVYCLLKPRYVNALLNKATSKVSLILLLTFVGYFIIYLILPIDLAAISQRLTFSLDRLLLALWPSTLVLIFSIR